MTLLSPTADLWFFAAAAFLFGLVFGSFLNVCIYRLPRVKSVVSPRSACPNCHTPIAAFDNIPVLSWWILNGKCRTCKQPIAPRYWMVELMTGILFLSCVLHFGVTLTAVKFCAFSFLILGLIFTDADTQLLPDTLTLPGLWIGLLFSLFVPVNGVLSLLYMAGMPHIPFWAGSLLNAAVSAAFGAGFIYIVGEAWYRLRGIEAMGFGDVKLMGMIGAFLGAKLVLLTILFGSLSGSIIGLTMATIAHRKRMRRWRNAERSVARARAQHAVDAIMRRFPIPFGVFLGMGALVSAFFGPDLIAWYTRQFL